MKPHILLKCPRENDIRTHRLEGKLVSDEDIKEHPELKKYEDLYQYTCMGCGSTFTYNVNFSYKIKKLPHDLR